MESIMIKDDRIYQTLLKYDFDLFRGEKNIAEYMEDHLNHFYEDIVDATNGNNEFLGDEFIELLKQELNKLRDICTEIPAIINAFDNGHIKNAYSRSEVLFDRAKSVFLARVAHSGYGGNFFRIRPGDFRITDPADSKKQKAELFHIKKSMRNRIGAYRYSVAGYPCLYLSSDIELAWFECGMPKQFSFCQMHLSDEEEFALSLIDFSYRPLDLLSSVTTWLLNARRQNKDQSKILPIYNVLIKYIITYPFAAACSVKVKNRGNKFVEEYIFPQLLMHWIRESEDIDGVRYKSSLNSTLVRGFGAINVALPVKHFRDDGLDETLTAKIQISDIGYLDINNDFKKHQKTINEIKCFINKLHLYTIESVYSGPYIREIIDLCECIIKTYTALIEGNYENPELVFTHVERLCDHADLLILCKSEKINECYKRALPHEKDSIDVAIIEAHFKEFQELSSKILTRNVVFNFEFESPSNYEYI